MSIPAELDLVAACCRWPPSADRDAAVRAAASRGVDWSRFWLVTARHRVEGLVHDGLGRAGIAVPPDVADRLAAATMEIARDNLLFAAESVRLGKAFADAGISFIFLKGATLSVLAYGTLAIKKAADVDVAVDPARYVHAVSIFRQLGYQCCDPRPEASDAEILAWSAKAKHTIWLSKGMAIELHSSLVDSPLMLPTVSVHSPRQSVEIASGMALPTLAREELYAYLCVHGAYHAWSRLKWLADVAALLKQESLAGIEQLHLRSIELGGGRSSGQALILSADLFDLALPPMLESELRRDRAVGALVRVAMKSLLLGGGTRELDETIFGTVAIHGSHLRLVPGWPYKRAELRRKFGLSAVQEGGPGLLSALAAGPLWLLRRARQRRSGNS